ncbi:hypothetical protein BX666DRAFT_878676 [Dichotomocladium elegans]|nr:hypothetical protein BX666DRAFT_878676 [Dichotomocladium elegans]
MSKAEMKKKKGRKAKKGWGRKGKNKTGGSTSYSDGRFSLPQICQVRRKRRRGKLSRGRTLVIPRLSITPYLSMPQRMRFMRLLPSPWRSFRLFMGFLLMFTLSARPLAIRIRSRRRRRIDKKHFARDAKFNVVPIHVCKKEIRRPFFSGRIDPFNNLK